MDRAQLVEGGAASPAAAEWLVYVAHIDAETGATDEARRLVGKLARDACSALAMDANWHGACVLADAAVLVADREAGAALYTLLEQSSPVRSDASGPTSTTSAASPASSGAMTRPWPGCAAR